MVINGNTFENSEFRRNSDCRNEITKKQECSHCDMFVSREFLSNFFFDVDDHFANLPVDMRFKCNSMQTNQGHNLADLVI